MSASLYIQPLFDNREARSRNRRETLEKRLEPLSQFDPQHLKISLRLEELRSTVYASPYYYYGPYNVFDTLPKLGLSWSKDISPLLNDDSELDSDGVQHFIELLLARPLNEDECKVAFANGVEEPQHAVNYFIEQKHELLSLLLLARTLQLPILCSL